MNVRNRTALLRELAENRAAYIERVRWWRGVIGYEEDVVQDAFARAAATTAPLPDESRREEWFFRVLRSAYVDHLRRSDVHQRTLFRVAHEALVAAQLVPEAPELACSCLHRGLSALRPEYRHALEAVELGGRSLQDFAASVGITTNNAAVRTHRARIALARLTRACCRGCRTSSDGCACHAPRGTQRSGELRNCAAHSSEQNR